MPDQELIARVAELREKGRTPKEIARALGLRPSQVAPLIRAVGEVTPKQEAPLAGCWVTANWSAGLEIAGDHPDWPGIGNADLDDGESGLAGVLVAREHGSSVSVVGFLVDVWCLGVKDAWPPKTMNRVKLPEYRARFFSSFRQPSLSAPLDLAQHLVFGAVDYAKAMGLDPHPDYLKSVGHLGEWNGPSDITFGRDGKPLYINGPHDDAFGIISKLRASVGDDGFHYVLGGSPE